LVSFQEKCLKKQTVNASFMCKIAKREELWFLV